MACTANAIGIKSLLAESDESSYRSISCPSLPPQLGLQLKNVQGSKQLGKATP
jgi:hypothetical protein